MNSIFTTTHVYDSNKQQVLIVGVLVPAKPEAMCAISLFIQESGEFKQGEMCKDSTDVMCKSQQICNNISILNIQDDHTYKIIVEVVDTSLMSTIYIENKPGLIEKKLGEFI